MVQTNFFQKEISLKFIYYGRDSVGKKTTLHSLHKHLESKQKTKIQDENFDDVIVHHFIHIPRKALAGMKIKCGIYCIPEEGLHSKKVLSLLESVDGIIFAADLNSTTEEAAESYKKLEAAFKKIDEKLMFRSMVMQYTKKDLVDNVDEKVEAFNTSFNKLKKKHFASGEGSAQEILDTWECVYSQVMIEVRAKLDSTTKSMPKTKLKFNFNRKKEVEETEEDDKGLKIPKKFAKKDEEPDEYNDTRIDLHVSEDESKKASEIEVIANEDNKTSETEVIADERKKASETETIAEHNQHLIKKQMPIDSFFEESSEEGLTSAKTESFSVDEKEMDSINRLKVTNQLLSELDTSLREQRAPETLFFESTSDEEKTRLDENLYSETLSLKSSPLVKEMEDKSSEQALEKIKNGEILQNAKLDLLDLRNYNFVDPIRISKCQIGSILCDGSDFNGPFIIEDTKISQHFSLSSNIGSLFRDSIKLKRVEVDGEIVWDGVVASKEVTILDSTWNSNAQIQRCAFEKEVFIANSNILSFNCKESNFRGEFTMTGCRFEDNAEFQGSNIEDRLYISSSYFQKAYFCNTHCKSNVEVINSTFDKIGSFKKMHIAKGFCLEGCVFNGRADFSEARINGEFEVRRTEFFEDTFFHKVLATANQCFENVTFSAMTDFSKASLNQADFIQSYFKGITHFHEAIFSEDASFLESTFENTTNFSRAIFYKKVDFTECAFNGRMSFRGMIGDYVVIHRDQVEKKLVCDSEKNQEMIRQEYLTLKRIMDKQRRLQDKDWAHYHAKRAERRSKKINWFNPMSIGERFVNWLFLDIGSRYGTRPQNIIILGVLLCTFFASIYAFVFPEHLQPTDLLISEKLGLDSYSFFEQNQRIFAGLELSLKAIIPGTAMSTSLQSSLWMWAIVMLESCLGIILAFMLSILLVRKLLQS
ncbi:pentapeptide repeat-containing protein [Candidatus Uabimicrobium sp. HlEnr_7]|uniref:pentapeptide repeat-containing protein n=1 Tax=Candidatus Uabimicrobium helgolandensis TaxID=3095367 RepID=UPI0035579369